MIKREKEISHLYILILYFCKWSKIMDESKEAKLILSICGSPIG